MKAEKMDELSTLIKEAKPLYYKKKYQKERVKTTFALLFIMFAIGLSAVGGYNFKNDVLTYSSSDVNAISQDTQAYPTDEYGLITVEY